MWLGTDNKARLQQPCCILRKLEDGTIVKNVLTKFRLVKNGSWIFFFFFASLGYLVCI